jgi:DNA polymerase-3 subunit beta
MRLVCSRDSLLEGILTVQKAVPQKTTLPILQGVLLDCRDEDFKLTATDLELGIECRVEGEVLEKGWVVLDARLLGEIIRKLPPEEIEFSVNEGYITEIKCANSVFHLQGKNGGDFPELPRVDGERSLMLPQDLLKSMIRQTVFACAVDEIRPILTGALLECSREEISMAALDGFRLAVRTVRHDIEDEISVVIPAKTLNEIQKILRDDRDSVRIDLAGNQVLFGMEDTRVISRLLEGDFINYRQIIPDEYNTSVKVKNSELMDSCERASLLAREGKNNLIKFDIKKDSLQITSNAEIGEVLEEISVETEGNDLEIAFNSKYLTDVLKVVESEYIRMEFTTGVSPCIMKPEDGEKYIYLLLPVRVIS